MNLISLLAGSITTVICAVVNYFIFLPPFALSSVGFWVWIISSFGLGAVASGIADYFTDDEKYKSTIAFGSLGVFLLLIFTVGACAGSTFFHASQSSSMLKVTDVSSFTDVVESKSLEEVENTFPKIDQESATTLANRKLGELVDLVSQFEVDDYCTLINYNGKPYRVAPLKYSNIFKYMKNKENGIPGYILIDLVTKEAKYVELEEGMKYSPSAMFSKDLTRRLRSEYSNTILGDYSFEIDDNGTPYWIIPEVKATKGINGLKDTVGVFVVNAQTGDVAHYTKNDIPSWIDRAFDTDIVREQIDHWGEFSNGFWNAHFSQQGVKVSTSLYNFIIEDDDVYLYTGITSAKAEDKSNIGFVTVNMRTGEAKFITISSADEESAKQSAEGKVQEKGYKATDPILLNLNGIPTYALSLKDEGGLVKMYAFVSVEDYQKVSVADESEGISTALESYMKYFKKEDIPVDENAILEVNLQIEQIEKAEVYGNSTYYIVSQGKVYVADIFSGGKAYENAPYFSCLPTLKVGDTVKVKCIEKDNYYEVREISKG